MVSNSSEEHRLLGADHLLGVGSVLRAALDGRR
jgi:hypothetical protein